MEIKKFNRNTDFEKIDNYLKELYLKNKNMKSWLPQRFHDLVLRIDAQHVANGKKASQDYIFIFEEQEKIVGCILPDGAAIYISVQNGYESRFQEMVEYAEENCKDLFSKEEDGSINFLVVANDSDQYKQEVLKKMGYQKDKIQDYDNYVYPQKWEENIILPSGYHIAFGEEIEEEYEKWSKCDMGFHPEYETDPNFKENMDAYYGRKNSFFYKDSFECMVVTEEKDICSYSFVYVDKRTSTAFIEPVSTRLKYRHKGLGSAMMKAVIKKCKDLGIQKCYVNSYDDRVYFYRSAGFKTEDCIGFWYKKITGKEKV